MDAGDTPSWTWPSLPDVYPSALAWEVSVAGPGAPVRHPWNFSSWIPNAVLINLGTNDAGIVPKAIAPTHTQTHSLVPASFCCSAANRFGNATFVRLFTSTYIQFVHNISSLYGSGPTFFLGWGPMSTAYEESVQLVRRVAATDKMLPHLRLLFTLGRSSQIYPRTASQCTA